MTTQAKCIQHDITHVPMAKTASTAIRHRTHYLSSGQEYARSGQPVRVQRVRVRVTLELIHLVRVKTLYTIC